MKKQDFYFDLPPELIAQYPLPKRSDSRLLTFNRQEKTMHHDVFSSLSDKLREGDLLVFNNSKVIPARFIGHKASGGRVEFLLERVLDKHTFLAHIKASKAPKPGTKVILQANWELIVLHKEEDLYQCRVEGDLDTMLQDIGQIPLPPYITRLADENDKERYQTVYAAHKGSVAAPTAGLHFDQNMFDTLAKKGVRFAYLTLHVGAGTFRPVRVEELSQHKMHKEQCVIDESLCQLVNDTRAQGKRVIAVGTTAMRSLETAACDKRLNPYLGDTDIFIYPGYQFAICDGLLTNFHLPESTLLMLVAAFIGHQETMMLYQEAIKQQYRFFSYGDASLLL